VPAAAPTYRDALQANDKNAMPPSKPAASAKQKAVPVPPHAQPAKAAPAHGPASTRLPKLTRQEALQFHAEGRPGKLEIVPTKPMATQRDLSLAYSPGVAVPVEAIAENPALAYDYTTKGNLVAVISNGTAILGLGNLGALASKPVMEGKSVLFKRFADVDSIDIEVDTQDVDAFVNAVRYLGPSWGGINLEDIKAPDCFIIEQQLRELMDIPVFHDDQHGTAIIAVAGLINALHLTGREMRDVRLVCNGAGAAGIACLELMKAMGLPHENAILCDTTGVIYRGREKGMNQWKSAHAVDTKARTLAEAVEGSDVFFGLSAAGALTKDMVASMAPKPIIFAMANPDPEITPEEVAEVRDDAIIATGRSDYPNQVNNVLGFPYIFRGALDVQARTINEPMKIAAAEALAELARADVPDKVTAAYGRQLRYGPDYIIPAPFDPRLISAIPAAVAKAAMDSGVARRPIVDMNAYRARLEARLDPAAGFIGAIFESLRLNPKRVVFAEGEEQQVIRAASAFRAAKLGSPILVGREGQVRESAFGAGVSQQEAFEVQNARTSEHNTAYAEFLYSRLQRRGYLFRDCQRLVNNDRNVFAACMLAMGHADAMVTGVTRNWSTAFTDVRHVLDPKPGRCVIGLSVIVSRNRVVLVADTSVHDMPNSEELAQIAVEAASVAHRFGITPRVALLAYSTFGHPTGERAERVREAVKLLDARGVDFEYDGEMGADVALNRRAMALYPFCRLTDVANVLVMPAFHSASISTKMLQELGGGTVIGPMLVGLSKPVQIASLGATDSDLVNMAALAAFDVTG
jgi:malate dehydrogenase (oxaloacetate-decarboxylating)(NADP+)